MLQEPSAQPQPRQLPPPPKNPTADGRQGEGGIRRSNGKSEYAKICGKYAKKCGKYARNMPSFVHGAVMGCGTAFTQPSLPLRLGMLIRRGIRIWGLKLHWCLNGKGKHSRSSGVESAIWTQTPAHPSPHPPFPSPKSHHKLDLHGQSEKMEPVAETTPGVVLTTELFSQGGSAAPDERAHRARTHMRTHRLLWCGTSYKEGGGGFRQGKISALRKFGALCTVAGGT